MSHHNGTSGASGNDVSDGNGVRPRQWIHLTEKKDFSRLLYPNPVCFLSTTTSRSSSPPPSHPAKGESGLTLNTAAAVKRRNVMVLSWLTATNNSGRFMFSINRNRHSASTVVPIDESSGKARAGVNFVLSCPVQGMEQLVIDVGGTSGKWGSKFMEDHNQNDADLLERSELDLDSMSNSQRKKHKRMQLAKGIPNLCAVPLGNLEESAQEGNGSFAINGTCAHMHCRTFAVVDEPATGIIDEDHHLVMAEIIDAYVDELYWDATKKQFRPTSEDVPPYLTFFGAQTFGYVRNR
jgi:flavin reductase (DIM6/NTAB) family NADH-FMN oxidoreductase RutF